MPLIQGFQFERRSVVADPLSDKIFIDTVRRASAADGIPCVQELLDGLEEAAQPAMIFAALIVARRNALAEALLQVRQNDLKLRLKGFALSEGLAARPLDYRPDGHRGVRSACRGVRSSLNYYIFPI